MPIPLLLLFVMLGALKVTGLLIKRPRLCTDTEYRSAWAAVTGTAHGPGGEFRRAVIRPYEFD